MDPQVESPNLDDLSSMQIFMGFLSLLPEYKKIERMETMKYLLSQTGRRFGFAFDELVRCGQLFQRPDMLHTDIYENVPAFRDAYKRELTKDRIFPEKEAIFRKLADEFDPKK